MVNGRIGQLPLLAVALLFFSVFAVNQHYRWNDTAIPRRRPLPRNSSSNARSCGINEVKKARCGENCDLVLFLHFHKSGGSSMIEYLRSERNWNGTESVAAKDDIDFVKQYRGKLKIQRGQGGLVAKSSSKFPKDSPSPLGDPAFWANFRSHDRRVDFVSMEYNFMDPSQYWNVSACCFRVLTMMRDPWERFHSTYERELYLHCRDSDEPTKCLQINTLQSWMNENSAKYTFPRRGVWGGTLHPNYYVRMLNGINDQRNVSLTREHLENAKALVSDFELVLLLEAADEHKLQQLECFLGNSSPEDVSPRSRLVMPHVSNNGLKLSPMYSTIRNETAKMRATFDRLNQLDMELYKYVKENVAQKRRML